MAAQNGVKTIITKAGSIVDLGLFSIQLSRSDNLDHHDLAISKGSKRTESACCAISGKSFGKETVLTASVPQKYIALSSSAVSMNIERSLQEGSSVVGHDNDSPTYGILHNSTSQRSEVRCCEKNNPPLSMIVGIDEDSKSSDHLENEYEIQNVETTTTTGLDNVGENNAVEKKDKTLNLQFIEKSSMDITGEKTMNCCKQTTEKQLGASTSEVLGNTKGLEKAVSPVCQIKVWATVVSSGAMNLKNYRKWLKVIEPEPKSTRATTGSVAVVRSVFNIPQKVTSTRRAFKEKSDRSSKVRQAVLGWKQKHGGSIDCVITSFVCRFDVLVIASAKRVNIPDVQHVLLGWIIGKNELKSTIHFSKLYCACRARALNKLATVIRFSSK